MNVERFIASLVHFPSLLTELTNGLDEIDAHWRPSDADWSIVEIVRHLADEEAEDFPVRLESTLRDPNAAWPPIDPEGWARERDYQSDSLAQSLELFRARRADRLMQLQDWVKDADWTAAYEHPQIGPIRAGDLFAAWAGHDMLHARQIVKRRFQLIERDAGSFGTRYAGEWTA